MFKKLTVSEMLRNESTNIKAVKSKTQDVEMSSAESTLGVLETVIAINEIEKIERAQAEVELIELIMSMGGN